MTHSVHRPNGTLDTAAVTHWDAKGRTWPEYSPSGAMKSSFFKPYRMGFLKVTCTWNRTPKSETKKLKHKLHNSYGICSTAAMQLADVSHPCQWCSTTWVMDDVCHNSFDVAIPLCRVKCAMLSGSFPCSGVGDKHTPSSLTLGANHATHLQAMRKAQYCRLPVACTPARQAP